MRIITAGTVPAKTGPLRYQATCSKCLTTFEFTEQDTELTPDPLVGDVAVTCPLPGCGNRAPLFLGRFCV